MKKSLLIVGALLGVLGFLYVRWHRLPAAPVAFTVAHGTSTRETARALAREHLIWHPSTFVLWARTLGRRAAIQPGYYQLSPRWTSYRIFRVLQKGPAMVKVTLPEGWTSRQMAAALESRNVTAAQDFLSIVDQQKLEGYLFPDTYQFEQGLPAAQVVQRLTQRFEQMAPKDMAVQAKALKLTERQIVTLASLVEKEARVPSERPMIAGIFYNRLKKRWRLESCATVQYALGSWKPRLTYDDLNVESPYNTYRHAGLPPGPIANPGAAALEAAAHPAQTDLMFFFAEGGGTHQFSRYYQEHLQRQKALKAKKRG